MVYSALKLLYRLFAAVVLWFTDVNSSDQLTLKIIERVRV